MYFSVQLNKTFFAATLKLQINWSFARHTASLLSMFIQAIFTSNIAQRHHLTLKHMSLH